jgi:hypothetical protein
MEKSSKNLISVIGEKPARGLPKPPPRKIAITFLLLIALTKCAYLLLASLASKTASYIVRAKPIKGSPS